MTSATPTSERRIAASIEPVYRTLSMNRLKGHSLRLFMVKFTVMPFQLGEDKGLHCRHQHEIEIKCRAHIGVGLDFAEMVERTRSAYVDLIEKCRQTSDFLEFQGQVQFTLEKTVSDRTLVGTKSSLDFKMEGNMDDPRWDLAARAISSRSYVPALTDSSFSIEEEDHSEETLRFRGLDLA